jgi:glycine/D-amino acid oxidase-like deaminating enzyme
VIIVGAGIAGLSAAEQLGRAGARVLILEARNRLGGRVESLPGLASEHSIELGAEFVHGDPPVLGEYLSSHRLEVQETRGQDYCAGPEGLQPCEEPSAEVFERLDRMGLTAFPDEAFEESLRLRVSDIPEQAKRWASRFVKGFHAADPERVSTHSLIFVDFA